MRRMPSPSMVVACVALFVALGGTGIAATVLVRSPSQLKNGVVTSPKIRNATITSADVRDGALKGVDLRDGTVGLDKLAPDARQTLGGARTAEFTAQEIVRREGPNVTQAGAEADVLTLPALAPGTYLITAKTVIESTRPNQGLLDEALKDPKTYGATCRLIAGGDEDVSLAPVSSPYTLTPNTLNLQLTRTVDSPIDVRLSCATSGTTWRAASSSIVALKLTGSSRRDATG